VFDDRFRSPARLFLDVRLGARSLRVSSSGLRGARGRAARGALENRRLQAAADISGHTRAETWQPCRLNNNRLVGSSIRDAAQVLRYSTAFHWPFVSRMNCRWGWLWKNPRICRRPSAAFQRNFIFSRPWSDCTGKWSARFELQNRPLERKALACEDEQLPITLFRTSTCQTISGDH
jgi:hypothetical protein